MPPAKNSVEIGEARLARDSAATPGAPSDEEFQPLLSRLCDVTADVVFFPVRHHSPIAASLVARLIAQMRPVAVLIEGPSDYNDHLDELLLDHELPIAIYSYFKTADGISSGAYYPFCEYSPEWSALRAAAECGAIVRMIDLPWTAVADVDRTNQRYADAELRRGRYIKLLCDRLEVEGFDELWDKLIESHAELPLETYLARVNSLTFHVRLWEESVSVADRRREAFMAEEIRRIRADLSTFAAALSSPSSASSTGQILVVTGGFHSSALAARLEGLACPGLDLAEIDAVPVAEAADAPPIVGIALTSYSYERLDSLAGYDAGMPSPGFYEHVWRQRHTGKPFSHQQLLAELVRELRQRGQSLSTADLVAVETSARGLAALRGRGHVWRRDLIDAVTSALCKDEVQYGCRSPFMDAVHAVLRGCRRGRLDARTPMPPLVIDIQNQLAMVGIDFNRGSQEVNINLLVPAELAKSQLLHRLRVLNVTGIEYVDGTDFVCRDDMTRLWERWQVRWSPQFDSACIEASRYGPSLSDAATSRLEEIARESRPSAAAAAALLVQAARAGVETLSSGLLENIEHCIEKEAEFCPSAAALENLLFLYCFDEALGTTGRPELGKLLRSACERSLWLLELMGSAGAQSRETLAALKTLFDAFQRTAAPLELNAEEFQAVLQRVEQDAGKPPQVRGAAAGMLWSLGAADADRVLNHLLSFVEPDQLGDFLAGLFALAREVAQRHPRLVQTIDKLVTEFSAEDFQQALPPLRLAFTFFTPREKHYMLTTLFESLGVKPDRSLLDVKVNEATAAHALAIDERVFEAIRKYGLGAESTASPALDES